MSDNTQNDSQGVGGSGDGPLPPPPPIKSFHFCLDRSVAPNTSDSAANCTEVAAAYAQSRP
jgi:hypothetical protein